MMTTVLFSLNFFALHACVANRALLWGLAARGSVVFLLSKRNINRQSMCAQQGHCLGDFSAGRSYKEYSHIQLCLAILLRKNDFILQ